MSKKISSRSRRMPICSQYFCNKALMSLLSWVAETRRRFTPSVCINTHSSPGTEVAQREQYSSETLSSNCYPTNRAGLWRNERRRLYAYCCKFKHRPSLRTRRIRSASTTWCCAEARRSFRGVLSRVMAQHEDHEIRFRSGRG